MKVIYEGSNNVRKALGRPKETDGAYRFMHYVVEERTCDGVLLLNNLTREMVLLSEEEYERSCELEELRERWFVVPENTDDMAQTDRVRFIMKALRKKPENITSYTIFTTTDCNARCFYCYELGRSRIPMSEETARRSAAYIASHCGGSRVRLGWFGGEPLYNSEIISIICRELADKGIEYRSTMISNAFLFDDELVREATELWKLARVQVTLDGTEEVYNRSKAYIYKDCASPYQVVLSNIERLLDAGIRVCVRMNIDNHNADDLLELADELKERFGGRKLFSAYSHTLFEFAGNAAHVRESEERKTLYLKQLKLADRLRENGLAEVGGIRKNLKLNHCMADSDSCVTILPGGELGVCEHYSEDHFVGTLDSETLDQQMLKEFRELREPIEACRTCFDYPLCMRLRKCVETAECFAELQEEKLAKTRAQMLVSYDRWLKNEAAAEVDEDEEDDDAE